MTFLEFVERVIGHTAWPAVLLIVLLYIKRNAGEIRKFVKRISYKDFEIELFEEARAEAQRVGDVADVSDDEDARFQKLMELEPSLAIVKIWRELEDELNTYRRAAGDIERYPLTKYMQKMRKEGEITENEFNLFMSMREIRNLAVHTPHADVTPGEVYEFNVFSNILRNKLRRLREAAEAKKAEASS